ncbi:hypothetical protein M885DRAFT_593831 [Pelagophyceae sp. CCMP2097]|nr:hypothetical protein M885DRAFT_593831 [Pelagophyceae sp. CCMP2097]
MAFLRGALLACALLGSAPAAAQTTYPDSSWREYLTTKINNKDECSTFETWQSTALPAALSGGATPIAIKLTTAYGDALCTTKAPEIVAKLAACTSSRCSDETWTCDGNFWSIGKCGKGIEIQAFLDGSSGKVCYCAVPRRGRHL